MRMKRRATGSCCFPVAMMKNEPHVIWHLFILKEGSRDNTSHMRSVRSLIPQFGLSGSAGKNDCRQEGKIYVSSKISHSFSLLNKGFIQTGRLTEMKISFCKRLPLNKLHNLYMPVCRLYKLYRLKWWKRYHYHRVEISFYKWKCCVGNFTEVKSSHKIVELNVQFISLNCSEVEVILNGSTQSSKVLKSCT